MPGASLFLCNCESPFLCNDGVYAILEQQPMAIAKLLTARARDLCAALHLRAGTTDNQTHLSALVQSDCGRNWDSGGEGEISPQQLR